MAKNLRDKILRIISGTKLASLATIAGGKPWVRYVVSHNKGKNLNLYICTYKDSRKIRQIRKNPNVHITPTERKGASEASEVIEKRSPVIYLRVSLHYWRRYG